MIICCVATQITEFFKHSNLYKIKVQNSACSTTRALQYFCNCPKMIYLALANFSVANFEIGSMVLWFAFLYCQNLLNYDRIISWLIFLSFLSARANPSASTFY